MRIAVWHHFPSGGGKRALYNHVRGLVGRGHHVESWCPSTADQTYLPLGDLIPEHILPFEYHAAQPTGRLKRIVATYGRTVDKIKAMDAHCRLAAAQINQGGFDLLFAGCCPLLAVTSIARYVAMPKAIYIQEPYRPLYEAWPKPVWMAKPPPAGSRFSKRYVGNSLADIMTVHGLRVQAREEWENARAYDTILVNSYFSRESLLRAYGLDARVCYLGVDTDLFHELNQPRENFVVGLGELSGRKNAGFIIEALALVAPPRPELVWIGNTSDPAYLAAMQTLAQQRKVVFTPRVRVSDAELVALLNRASLMLYAPRLEPFGFAPLEANACGVPVVAVAEGGVRETVLDNVNGLLTEATPQAMAQAIETLLKQPERARELGKAGAALARERWSLPASIDRLEAALHDTLAKKQTVPKAA